MAARRAEWGHHLGLAPPAARRPRGAGSRRADGGRQRGALAAVRAGRRHGARRGPDDSVWTWGANAQGQLGDGTQTVGLTPAPIAGPEPVMWRYQGPDANRSVKCRRGATWVPAPWSSAQFSCPKVSLANEVPYFSGPRCRRPDIQCRRSDGEERISSGRTPANKPSARRPIGMPDRRRRSAGLPERRLRQRSRRRRPGEGIGFGLLARHGRGTTAVVRPARRSRDISLDSAGRHTRGRYDCSSGRRSPPHGGGIATTCEQRSGRCVGR
ncbi:MAG: hypothetical protein JNM38_01920 [Acidobacteria bacterium]|nr:hypothetical protein [Acidobacteriota bacterium]